jgi:hypothetical protein
MQCVYSFVGKFAYLACCIHGKTATGSAICVLSASHSSRHFVRPRCRWRRGAASTLPILPSALMVWAVSSASKGGSMLSKASRIRWVRGHAFALSQSRIAYQADVALTVRRDKQGQGVGTQHFFCNGSNAPPTSSRLPYGAHCCILTFTI